MNTKTLLLTALSASLLIGTSAGTSLARMHGDMGMGMRVPREIIFVRLLEQVDTNKDGKITKEEFSAAVDERFAAIDANKDGSLTPGEVRNYREAQWKAWADKRAKNKADAADDQAEMSDDDDTAMAPDEAAPADKAPEGKMQDRQRPPRAERMRHGGMMRDVMLFRMIDTDENGQISKEEAVAAGNKFFAWMDVNGDQVISIEDMPDRPFP